MFWDFFSWNQPEEPLEKNLSFIIKDVENIDVYSIFEVPTDETRYRMRNENALTFLKLYTSMTNEAHKKWILDWILRSLVGFNEPGGDERYEENIQHMLLTESKNLKKPIEECTWDVGTAP